MTVIVLCVVKGEVEGGDHYLGVGDLAPLGVRGGLTEEMTSKAGPEG